MVFDTSDIQNAVAEAASSRPTSAKYVPLARRLAEENKLVIDSSVSNDQQNLEDVISSEEVQQWSYSRRYLYEKSPTFRELQQIKKVFKDNPDVEKM